MGAVGYACRMSIIESLSKLVDPVQAREREEERKKEREQPKREASGDPPRFACRVCGHEDTQGDFCPTCLAGTMRPLPRTSGRR
jgi:rubrerythrin